MIILLPNIIVQLFAIYIFYERHWSGVSRHMSVALASEVIMIVKAIEGKQIDDLNDFVNLANVNMYLEVSFSEDGILSLVNEDIQKDFKYLNKQILTRLSNDFSLSYVENKSKLEINVQLPQGVLHIITSKKRISNPSTYIFIMWMTGAAAIFLVISIFFMRTQVRSITNIAESADKFGKDLDADKFKPSGAAEVRKVGKAFIDMRHRIKKQIQQRTEMLAGVSHDLKTPLTRIKLQLAMMDKSKIIGELQEDIQEMEKMVQGYLDFANGKERVIDATVNVSDLMRSIVAGYRHQHQSIDLKTKNGVMLHINSNAFRRVVANIIDNALRYSKNLQINVSSSSKNVILMFDDDGPGISPKKRKLVFKPFYRIDSSRHLESGSTGLGLSIAKDIVISYGGDIKLEDSPLSGLRVVIKIPL